MLISRADAAQEIARQSIMVMMVSEDISEAVVSVFNRMVRKKDEMRCILSNISSNRSDLEHDTYF